MTSNLTGSSNVYSQVPWQCCCDRAWPATFTWTILTERRYSLTEKKFATIPQPNLISSYNAHMGGVEQLDNYVAKYRIPVKWKKWWWSLLINYNYITVCNAWSLYQRVHGKRVDELDLRHLGSHLAACSESIRTKYWFSIYRRTMLKASPRNPIQAESSVRSKTLL